MYKTDSEDDVLECLEDVIRGHSKYKGVWFIKHLNVFEDNEIRRFYKSQMEELIEIPTKEDQEKMLIENDIWSKEKESELNLTKVRLEAAKATLPNVLIESQIKPIQEKINELESKYIKLICEKNEYLGSVREDVANDNACDLIIQKSVFKDSDLSELVFPDLDSIYEQSSAVLQSIRDYVFFIKSISTGYMSRKIACSNTFQALINILPKGEEYKIFERPVAKMTTNQISLIQYGQVFKSIIENYKIPDEDAEDPDKILEIPKKAQKYQEMIDKSESRDANTSYMGATKSEMKKMGMSGTDIFEMLEKSGKQSLGKDDLI